MPNASTSSGQEEDDAPSTSQSIGFRSGHGVVDATDMGDCGCAGNDGCFIGGNAGVAIGTVTVGTATADSPMKEAEGVFN